MRAYPTWTAGTARPARRLMEAVPGLLLKSGAGGVEGLALADGRARHSRSTTAMAPRARTVVAGLANPGVLGGGRKVGEIRAALPFLSS